MQNTSPASRRHRWLEVAATCPRCGCGEPARAGRDGGLESGLQVEEVALHLHCTAEEKGGEMRGLKSSSSHEQTRICDQLVSA